MLKPVSFNAEELLAQVLCFVEKHVVPYRGIMDQLAKRYRAIRDAYPMLMALGLSVLRNYILLDFVAENACGIRVSELDCFNRWLLRVVVYEIRYRDISRDRVDKYLKRLGLTGNCFSILRYYDIEPLLQRMNLVDELSIRYSIPRWIVEYVYRKIIKDEVELKWFIRDLAGPQPTWIRVNLLKTSRSELKRKLREYYIFAYEDPIIPDVLLIEEGKDKLTKNPLYDKGYYMLQNRASTLVAHNLGVRRRGIVYDLCSAPGGKALHIASLTKCKAHVIALDISSRRLGVEYEMVKWQGAENCISIIQGDVLAPPLLSKAKYIVLDPDCTSLGRLGHSPEIRLWVKPEDVKRMARIQKKLLSKAVDLAPSGARIVYSTCTITLEENEEVVESVLSTGRVEVAEPLLRLGDPGIGLRSTLRLYPHKHKSLGFYVAVLEKK